MEQQGTPAGSKLRRPPALVIAVIIAVVLLVIAVAAGALAVRRYEAYLGGLWVGDPAFLRTAQLSDMQLFLAPLAQEPEGSQARGCRQGYLLMTDLNGDFLANQSFELRVGSVAQRWWSALRSAGCSARDAYTARCVELEYDGPADQPAGAEPPMPERMAMALSLLDGTLTLHSEERVYAFLRKDHVASAAAVEAYLA
jgi:hypothetical protein